jgi:hypothetical protein
MWRQEAAMAKTTVRRSNVDEVNDNCYLKMGREPVGGVWSGFNGLAGRFQFLYRARGRWRLRAGCWDALLSKAKARIRCYCGSRPGVSIWMGGKLAVTSALQRKAAALDRAATRAKHRR